MKDYNEMAESVFKRREKYSAERKMAIRKSMAIVACCCLIAVLSIGVWYGNIDTPALRPTASEQLNNADMPTDTLDANTEQNGGNESYADTTIWLSADEVLKSAENDTSQMGVAVPMLITYQGTVYRCFSEAYIDNRQYAPLETEVILRKNYAYPAYQVKDISDSVAIVINGKLEIYKKLFEVKAVIDGTPYRIVQPMMSGIDYSYGEIIQENTDYSVYQAINAHSGEVMESEYVINILPLLKREFPNMFSGNENYGDAWWVAVPYSND